MDSITRDLLVSIAAFAGMFGILYVFLITRYRERMKMIEHGLDPSSANQVSSSLSLKFGMLAIGIGLGMLTANLLTELFNINSEIYYPAMMLLFGGASLVAYFLIERKKEN